MPNSLRNAKKQKIVDLLKENSAFETQSSTLPIDTIPGTASSSASHSGILVQGSNNYVVGRDLSVQQPAAATPTSTFLEHVAFQEAAKVACSVAERSQLEWLVNERRFVLDDLRAAMRRGGLRWSEEHGQLAPGTASVSIALISFVFLVLLAFLTLFLVNWVPSHGRIDPVKFYGVGTLFLCGFAGFYCAIWYWSVVPLKTAFLAAKALKEKPAANR